MGLRTQVTQLYRPEIEVPFPLKEYQERMTKVKERMAREKVDLLYCSAPESLFYLSGYQNSWYRVQSPKGTLPLVGIAIRQDADEWILFDSAGEETLIQSQTIATDVRVHAGRESQVPGLEFVISNLKQEGWLKGTVGLEKWNYLPSPAVSEMFQAGLEEEGCTVVDGTDIVREVRAVKSPQEISYVRVAAKIADIGMRAAFEHITPGVTELDIRAEMDYACAKAGGEHPGLPTYVHAGQRSAQMHTLASRHRIMPGDIVYLDLCGVYHRYHADVARTLSVGEPHPDVAKQVDLSAKHRPVLMSAVKPHRRMSEVNEPLVDYYRNAGIWEDRWYVGGYDLGIAFPPDWVGVFWYGPGVDTGERIFTPGTVVNFESDFYLPQGAGGSCIMDTIVVNENVAEVLSQIPPDLAVVDA